MRFLFATLITSLITWILWPWVKQFFNYLKLRYNKVIPNETTIQESETSKSNESTGETNNETD